MWADDSTAPFGSLEALVSIGSLGGAWLSTYWLHSALMMGLVWLVVRIRFAGRDLVADVVWKAALLGAVVSSGVAVLGPSGIAEAGRFTRRRGGAEASPRSLAVSATSASPREMAVARRFMRPSIEVEGGRREVKREVRRIVRRAPHGGAALPTTRIDSTTVRDTTSVRLGAAPWLAAAFYLWLAGALVGLVRLGARHVRLGRALAGRRDVADAATTEALAQLVATASGMRRPRCTRSVALRVPAAIGTREICLPDGAWEALTPTQRRTVLAHEVAHLRRGDPAWLAWLGIVRTIFWIQPLNAVALRAWSEAADVACDDWAARATGRPKALASALAVVASWLPEAGAEPRMAALVSSKSPLVRRVERLLAPGIDAPRWLPAMTMVLAWCVILTACVAAPAIALAGETRYIERRFVPIVEEIDVAIEGVRVVERGSESSKGGQDR